MRELSHIVYEIYATLRQEEFLVTHLGVTLIIDQFRMRVHFGRGWIEKGNDHKIVSMDRSKSCS